MAANPDGFFAGTDHDHGNCVSSALDSAASVCQQRGVRLTPLRRQVLELVWQSHQPIGAYAVLDAMQSIVAITRRRAEPALWRRRPSTGRWSFCLVSG